MKRRVSFAQRACLAAEKRARESAGRLLQGETQTGMPVLAARGVKQGEEGKKADENKIIKWKLSVEKLS